MVRRESRGLIREVISVRNVHNNISMFVNCDTYEYNCTIVIHTIVNHRTD